MRCKRLGSLVALLALLLPLRVGAELPVGTLAPGFATVAAHAGKEVRFNLRAALAKGPVVLYFYPKAFTHGCTLETRAFAELHDEFSATGATVIGLSTDDLDTLKRFSTEACAGKFAVGIATPMIIRGYDVATKRYGRPTGMTDRTSYVISPDGYVALVHTGRDYREHVLKTLRVVRAIGRAN